MSKRIAFVLILCIFTVQTDRSSGHYQSWFPKAPPLQNLPPKTIQVSTVEQLIAAVNRIDSDATILLADGIYKLNRPITMYGKKNIALRSLAADPANVILIGQGWDTKAKSDILIRIGNSSDITIADLTFTESRHYAIKIEAEHSPRNIHVYNCRFRNIGVRAIKGSTGFNQNSRAMGGSIRYCRFENTKVPPANWLFDGDYISAIDMMALQDWTISHNFFRNINGRNGRGRAAIFIWVRSRKVIVERNVILDCDEGISFGSRTVSSSTVKGEKISSVVDGIIENNFLYGWTELGFGIWDAERIKIYNNRILRSAASSKKAIIIGRTTTGTEILKNQIQGSIQHESSDPNEVGGANRNLDSLLK
jgi:pectate lyase